jgi:hypothetical protein
MNIVTRKKVFFGVCASVLLLGTAWWAIVSQQNKEEKLSVSLVKNPIKAVEVKRVVPHESVVYRDVEYNFSMTFPERWRGYQVKTAEKTVDFEKSFDFSLKLKNPTPSGEYGSVFTVTVFTPTEWKRVSPHAGYRFIKNHKDNAGGSFVLAWTHGQDDFGFAGFDDSDSPLRQGPYFEVQNSVIPSLQ